MALFDFRWFPGGVEVMQGHEAFLDVGSGAHLLRAADQHAHRRARSLTARLSEAAFERSPPGKRFTADGCNDSNRGDDNDAGDQGIFQHFAAAFIRNEFDY
jgi:hypothetical protein